MLQMKQNENPYDECKDCESLVDCKHVEIAQDLLGTPFAPDNCPKLNKIMKETEKKHRHARSAK
jgi:hypothetical protein